MNKAILSGCSSSQRCKAVSLRTVAIVVGIVNRPAELDWVSGWMVDIYLLKLCQPAIPQITWIINISECHSDDSSIIRNDVYEMCEWWAVLFERVLLSLSTNDNNQRYHGCVAHANHQRQSEAQLTAFVRQRSRKFCRYTLGASVLVKGMRLENSFIKSWMSDTKRNQTQTLTRSFIDWLVGRLFVVCCCCW